MSGDPNLPRVSRGSSRVFEYDAANGYANEFSAESDLDVNRLSRRRVLNHTLILRNVSVYKIEQSNTAGVAMIPVQISVEKRATWGVSGKVFFQRPDRCSEDLSFRFLQSRSSPVRCFGVRG